MDLLKIQKHLLGVNKLKNAYLYASDINKDGNVDIIDLLSLSTLRFYSGRYHFRGGEIEDGYICFRFK